MLLSEARPRPYRQPVTDRGFDQQEVDDAYFDELQNRAYVTKKLKPDYASATNFMYSKMLDIVNDCVQREFNARLRQAGINSVRASISVNAFGKVDDFGIAFEGKMPAPKKLIEQGEDVNEQPVDYATNARISIAYSASNNPNIVRYSVSTNREDDFNSVLSSTGITAALCKAFKQIQDSGLSNDRVDYDDLNDNYPDATFSNDVLSSANDTTGSFDSNTADYYSTYHPYLAKVISKLVNSAVDYVSELSFIQDRSKLENNIRRFINAEL